jgi:hypothetical protein
MFDYNLSRCRFDTVEKRLSTLMLVASLFGVINFELITQSRLGTAGDQVQYNATMQYFAHSTSDLTLVRRYSSQSAAFLAKYGADPDSSAWWSEDENWIVSLASKNVERATWTQAAFVGLIVYLAAVYWGLSVVSADEQHLTIWYRFVALPVYVSTIFFVVTVYVLVEVYIDYLVCFLEASAAVLALQAYAVLTRVIIAVFVIAVVGSSFANYCALITV